MRTCKKSKWSNFELWTTYRNKSKFCLSLNTHSFFQGLLETEVNFYEKLLKELNFPPPRTLPYLWGNYQSLNREVLLLEHDSAFQNPQSNGLDLPHVLLAVEWLAKLHALSYVAKKNFEAKNPDKDWLLENPWIKKEIQDLGNDAKTL